jgi:hypothetical protein
MHLTEGTASGSPYSSHVSIMIYRNPPKVKKKVKHWGQTSLNIVGVWPHIDTGISEGPDPAVHTDNLML